MCYIIYAERECPIRTWKLRFIIMIEATWKTKVRTWEEPVWGGLGTWFLGFSNIHRFLGSATMVRLPFCWLDESLGWNQNCCRRPVRFSCTKSSFLNTLVWSGRLVIAESGMTATTVLMQRRVGKRPLLEDFSFSVNLFRTHKASVECRLSDITPFCTRFNVIECSTVDKAESSNWLPNTRSYQQELTCTLKRNETLSAKEDFIHAASPVASSDVTVLVAKRRPIGIVRRNRWISLHFFHCQSRNVCWNVDDEELSLRGLSKHFIRNYKGLEWIGGEVVVSPRTISS